MESRRLPENSALLSDGRSRLAQVRGPGGWIFDLAPEFQLIRNGDSVQAVAGDRVVYVSAMRVKAEGDPPSAGQLRETASRTLQSSKRLSSLGAALEGEAEIRHEAESFELRGFMCATATIATCVINFGAADEAGWAESVWRSLTHEGL